MNKKERILLKNQIAKAIFDDIEKWIDAMYIEFNPIDWKEWEKLKKKWLE